VDQFSTSLAADCTNENINCQGWKKDHTTAQEEADDTINVIDCITNIYIPMPQTQHRFTRMKKKPGIRSYCVFSLPK